MKVIYFDEPRPELKKSAFCHSIKEGEFIAKDGPFAGERLCLPTGQSFEFIYRGVIGWYRKSKNEKAEYLFYKRLGE